MKKLLFAGVFILIVLFCLSSCLDNDNDENSWYVDEVAVVTEGDSCYFVGSGGDIYVPQPKYTNKANMKVGAIQFKISKESVKGDDHTYYINLLYNPVPLDATVNSASSRLKLDSVKDNVVQLVKVHSFINNRYLVLGVNYNVQQKKHYQTLCYAEDEGFSHTSSTNVPDTLKFILRHNANGEENTSITSYDFFLQAGKISGFYYAYDIKDILDAALKKNNNKKMYIDVEYKYGQGANALGEKCHVGFNYPLK